LTFELLEARSLLSVVPTPAAASLFQPALKAHRLSTSDAVGSSNPVGLTPNEVRGAYGLGTYTAGVLNNGISFGGIDGDGRGQTIALIDLYDDPTALNDLNAFSTYFGLPTFGGAGQPTFQKLNQNGKSSPLPRTDPSGPASSDWEVEESLDMEWAHATAPMANIILFEASSDLLAAVQSANQIPGVVVISMSWTEDEIPTETQDDSSLFTTPSGHIGGAASVGGTEIAGGITYVAATGDSGAYDPGTTTIAPQYPASSPNVVAVGGTSLTINGDSYGSESSWGNGTASGGSAGGGGGGISQYEPQPTYQKGITNAFSTSNRSYPDVSADANPGDGVPVYDSYDFGSSTPWFDGSLGGTSLSTPLWTGIIAVADEGRAISGLGSLNGKTQTLPLLYQIDSVAPASFHDITTGNSIGPTSGSPSYYPGPGFDLATGIGSPAGNLLVPGLVGIPTVTTPASASPSPVTGGTTTLSVAATASDEASNLTYTWTATSLPTGAAAPTFSVNGTSAANNTMVTFSQTGTYTFSVTIADSLTGGSATSTVSVTVLGTVAAPAVTGVSPTAGPSPGGTTVTITGSGFTGATAVDFGSVAADSFTVNSATQITATSPAGTGTVDVTVVTPNSTSATSPADQFSYMAAPAVTGVSPTAGPLVGGTTVTITGSGFTGATAVDFGSVAAGSFTVNSATQITATSPAGTGTVNVTVVTPNGTSATSPADQFSYSAAPAVTGVSPTAGPLAGGTTVTITGSGFTGATAVDFGGVAAGSFTVNSATQITATSPAGTGTVDVTVVTPNGTSATSPADQFSYSAAPAVTGVSPMLGPLAGGTTVTITGSGFTGATAVDFGSVAAGSFTVNSATQITATSPAGTGTVDVTVVTPNGTSATSAADQFTYNSWIIVGTGDFTGSGKADVLWENTSTGLVGVWIPGTAGATWLGLGTAPLNAGWTIAGVGNFAGHTNGEVDILWENTSTGVVGAWLTAPTGVTWLNLGVAPLNAGWMIAGVGDFAGHASGEVDILWENTGTGQVGAWITGGGWLGLGVAPLNAGWTIAGVGDFNGDGKADVLWQNQSTGMIGAWITGTTGVSWLGLGTAPLNAGWTIAGVGDFNGDGKADVLWENTSTGVVGVWITETSGVSWLGLGGVPLNQGWTIAGVGDFNGDGKADVLWESLDTGVVGAWITGTSVSWLGLGTV